MTNQVNIVLNFELPNLNNMFDPHRITLFLGIERPFFCLQKGGRCNKRIELCKVATLYFSSFFKNIRSLP